MCWIARLHSISCRIQGTLPPHLCQAFHDRLHLPLGSVTLYVVLVTNCLLLRCSVSGSFRERKRSEQRVGPSSGRSCCRAARGGLLLAQPRRITSAFSRVR